MNFLRRTHACPTVIPAKDGIQSDYASAGHNISRCVSAKRIELVFPAFASDGGARYCYWQLPHRLCVGSRVAKRKAELRLLPGSFLSRAVVRYRGYRLRPQVQYVHRKILPRMRALYDVTRAIEKNARIVG
jgi:hypothetical protein